MQTAQPACNPAYVQPLCQPQPAQSPQQTQYTGYGTGNLTAAHGTGAVVKDKSALKQFAAGMNKLATGVALKVANASGGTVVGPSGSHATSNANVNVGFGECHYTECFNFMKAGYCANGHTLKCREAGCVSFMQFVAPNHVHQQKPLETLPAPVVTGTPIAVIPGTTTVPLGTGTIQGNAHGTGTVTLGSYGTGNAVVGPNPMRDIADHMSRAVTGVALAGANSSGGNVVGPQGQYYAGGNVPAGPGECHFGHCKFFMKTGYCQNGHTVQCQSQACPQYLQYVAPEHACAAAQPAAAYYSVQ